VSKRGRPFVWQRYESFQNEIQGSFSYLGMATPSNLYLLPHSHLYRLSQRDLRSFQILSMDYIIYARKSTESEDRQSLSIQSQIIEMLEIAKREGVRVVKIFQESKSAKAPGRPIFAEMMKFIEQGKAKGILCWKIDRLARNPVDEGMVKWMLQNKTIECIKTFDRDYNPDDNVVIASIEFSMANQYIRDLSKNVKRGFAEKVRRGEYPGCQSLGYNHDPKTKILQINPTTAPYVKTAYELYATKQWSILKIVDKLYEDGLRSRNGKKLGKSRLHRILSNPLYCGLFEWKGQVHKGVHTPIISKRLFDEAQEKLFPERYLTRKTKRQFLFRGLALCGECGLKITAEIKKGHTYYRCTKSHGTQYCSQKYIREEDLIEAIGRESKKVHFDDEILDLIFEASKEKYAQMKGETTERKEELTASLDEIRKRRESLIEKFIDNAIPKEIYDRKYSESISEEADIEEKIRKFGKDSKDVIKDLETIIRFVRTAHDIFNQGDDNTKKEVASLLSSNFALKDQEIAYFNLNEPFSWLAEDASVLLPQNTTFEPALTRIDKTKTAPRGTDFFTWRERRDSDPRPPQ
jgi:site-specific DNA recombinase